MTLRLEQLAGSLPGFVERYREGLDEMEAGLHAASSALDAWSADPGAADASIRAFMAGSSEPYALSFGEPPAATFDSAPLGPVTVVAADGSSIEPDRFAPVQCYVINTGFIVLPYGSGQDPEIGSMPEIGPARPGHDGRDDSGVEEHTLRGWGVNLRRDVRELELGAIHAATRAASGPTVLLLDGTLFPWDLDSRQVAERTRDELRERTQAALDSLAACASTLTMGAYISGSRSADVAASLRALGGRPDLSWPMSDSQVFARLLGHGQRSALFRAKSERVGRVEAQFSPAHQVCFFYLRTGGDIARVELPHWVAAEPARVALLHASLVDQCKRCGGYPRVLQEAHEQAVISIGDRLQFSRLLEAEADRQGLHAGHSGKSMSKRRRAL